MLTLTRRRGQNSPRPLQIFILFFKIKMANLQKTRAEYSIKESPRQTKKELYKYLDSFLFVGEFEIQDAILEFLEITAPSWGELAIAGEMAIEYMQNRDYYRPLLDINE